MPTLQKQGFATLTPSQSVEDEPKQNPLGEARPRREQGVELAGLPQSIEPTQRDEDALLRSAVAPVIFNDLEVGPRSGPFDAEEHGVPE